ncbi:WD40-repeat-containing domain protein [Armillaria novae-zelandiae]|uniref:WD40-repeat-containing domain protein n=1 Tax=Armillaria novae-zelandiae TaxID=153914 RepID=A0AA39PVU4_9AGAR|nr:WD40-repeat-containing domain protein [Armillaria novae-zelandiae]
MVDITLVRTCTLPIDPAFPHNFARHARWCPDGSSTVLVQSENRAFHVLHLDSDTKTFPQASPILSWAWYPTASPSTPATFCFVAAIRDCPIHLFDASDGRLRASYPIVDHREQHVAPHCMTFNLMGTKLYCGHPDAIEVFEVSQPGHEGLRIPTTPTKKSKDGLKGFVSAISFTWGYYAIGTLTPCDFPIAIYGEEDDELVGFVGGGPRAAVIQLAFTPAGRLLASFRRHSAIYAWDLSAPDAPVAVYDFGTPSTSNQRRYFDLHPTGRWLAVGDEAGHVHVFDLTNEHPTSFVAHEDAVPSVAFHPTEPLLLTVAGSRHFEDVDDEENEEKKLHPVVRDASIKVWSFISE